MTEPVTGPFGLIFAKRVKFNDLNLSGFETMSFNDSEAIFKDGDRGERAYVLETGMVEIFKRNPQGEMVSLAIMKPGDMFGELALIADAPRSASARAIGLTVCRTIHRDYFRRLLDELEPFSRRLMEQLIHTLYRSTNSVLLNSMSVDD